MNYFCIRCGFEFSRLRDYHKHVQKKTVCAATRSTEIPTEDNCIRLPSSYKCTLCDKSFADDNNLQRHLESQQHLLQKNIINSMKSLQEQLSGIKNDMVSQEKLQSSQDQLKQELFAKMDRAIVAKPDKDPNNFNLNLNLNLNIENLKDSKDFISNDRKYHLLQRGMNAMPFLVKDVNFDPKRPENHNMYISNNKTKTAQVKENGVWVKRDARQLVSDIIYDYDCKFFRSFAEDPELEEEYPKATIYYYKYIDITDSKEAQKKMQDEIMEMLYNNREMIIETRKKEEAAIKHRKMIKQKDAEMKAKDLAQQSSAKDLVRQDRALAQQDQLKNAINIDSDPE
jgi:uncharacterized C2H2 Zn-finger protein